MKTNDASNPRSGGLQPPGGDFKSPFLVLLLALAPIAVAGPRTSANYSLATDTNDAGGRRTTSASYTNDGSAGGVTGIAAVASPAETAKSGYIGQLYDVSGLMLTAAALNVSEGATDQLAAWLALDDATFLAVAAASVAWSVQSGALTAINASGLATAGVVYQNTAATAQGIHLGFTGTVGLTVLNVNPDNFGAYAGDTLDDAWQVQYFGQPPNALAGPAVDADGDGQTNLFEYTAGLIPTDANSVFRLRIEAVPGQPSRKRVIFNPIIAGRSYTLKFRPDLATGSWTTLGGTTQSDIGNERTVTAFNATSATKFYQLEITKPEKEGDRHAVLPAYGALRILIHWS